MVPDQWTREMKNLVSKQCTEWVAIYFEVGSSGFTVVQVSMFRLSIDGHLLWCNDQNHYIFFGTYGLDFAS